MPEKYRLIKYSGNQEWLDATIAKSLKLGETVIGEYTITIFDLTESEIKLLDNFNHERKLRS